MIQQHLLKVFDDVAETTINGVKVKYQDGAVYLDGTANAQFKVVVQFKQPIYDNQDYYVKLFTSGTTTATNPKAIGETSTDARLLIPSTTTFNVAYNINYFWFSVGANSVWTNYVVKPMIVKGTTEPTEWKQGFEGIHNLELSGLKVEGVNKANTALFELGAINTTNGADSVNNERMRSNYIEVKPSTQYTLKWDNNDVNYFFYDENKTYIQKSVGGTFTTTATTKYVRFYGGLISTSTQILFNEGTNTIYIPYVSQTLPIDLSTIVDSNNNKLFPNGKLMGYNDLKDVLGVYNQQSKWDEVDIGLQTIEATGIDTHTFKITLSSAKAPSDNDTLANLLMANYETVTYNSISTSGDMTMALRSDNVFVIRNNAYSTAEAFKTAMSGVMLQFERNTYLTSNTDLSATLRNIQGYPNGSIIAENTNNMDVESVITYNSIIQETLCPSMTVEGANLADSVTLTDNVSSDYNPLIVVTDLDLKPNTTYTISFRNVNTLASGTRYYITADNQSISYIYTGANSSKTEYSMTFTPSKPETTIRIRLQYTSSGNTGKTTNVMLNEGSTALSYRPHKDTITRNLPTITSDGYGVNADAHNLRVFSDYEGNAVNKRYTNVDKESNLGRFSYQKLNNRILSSNLATVIKAPTNNTIANILTKKYTTTSYNSVYNHSSDKIIGVQDNGNLGIYDTEYYDNFVEATFKTAMTNEPLYYELADASKPEPENMDDFDFFFDVEEGDVITFNNPYAQQVYATYSFIIKEAKSNE